MKKGRRKRGEGGGGFCGMVFLLEILEFVVIWVWVFFVGDINGGEGVGEYLVFF